MSSEFRNYRFSSSQVAGVMGLFIGCIVCAYYLGIIAGQEAGFASGREASRDALPKVAIRQDREPMPDSERDELLARLTAPRGASLSDITPDPAPLPELTSIAALRDAPIVPELEIIETAEVNAVKEETVLPKEVSVLGVGGEELEDLKEVPAKSVEKEVETPSEPIQELPLQTEKAQEADKPSSEKTVVEKRVVSPPPARRVANGWYAQVAAPKAMHDAQALGEKLRRSGFPVQLEEATVHGETYFRVLVGPESNRGLGEALIGQLERERYLTARPFLRQVK